MYHLRQALSGMRRAGFMSVACIMIMTFSLLILGIFLMATANLREVLRYAHEKVEIVAFLRDGVTRESADSLMLEIRNIPYVETIRYVSATEALERLRSEFGARSYILDALDVNPLPASIEVTLKPQYRLRQRIMSVAERIRQFPQVEDISYGRGWITRLERLVRAVAIADLGIGLVVAIAAMVTVSYTVRLTLYARREVIQVLKLVGATDWFIMWPFLIEGAIHGLVSAALSLLILYMGYRVIEVKLPQAVFVSPHLIVSYVVFATGVAVLGSWASLRSFLREKVQ